MDPHDALKASLQAAANHLQITVGLLDRIDHAARELVADVVQVRLAVQRTIDTLKPREKGGQ